MTGVQTCALPISITDAGRNVLTRVFPGHIAVLQESLFAPLDASDVDALGAVLERVRDTMRSTPPRSAAPRRRAAP